VLKLSPDLEQDIPSSQRERVSSSETEFPQKLEAIEGDSREGISRVLFENKEEGPEEETREAGKIIELPKANLRVGSISNKDYERRHGLRENPFWKRVLKKYVTKPVGEASFETANFMYKSGLRAKKDVIDLLLGKWSGKHRGYRAEECIPLLLRVWVPLGLGSATSYLLGKTALGKKSLEYRKNRRNRVEGMKDSILRPFLKMGTKISKALPAHEKRFGVAQKVRGMSTKGTEILAEIDSRINRGLKGLWEWKKRKNMQKETKARKKGPSTAPNLQEEQGFGSERRVISRNKKPMEEPIIQEVPSPENPSEKDASLAA